MTLPDETLGEAIDRLNRDIDELERSRPWGRLVVRGLRRDVEKLENQITKARDESLRRYFAS